MMSQHHEQMEWSHKNGNDKKHMGDITKKNIYIYRYTRSGGPHLVGWELTCDSKATKKQKASQSRANMYTCYSDIIQYGIIAKLY